MKLRSILSCIFFSLAHNAIGQTCCTGGAPITGSINSNGVAKGQFTLNMAYDYNWNADLFEGTSQLNSNTVVRKTRTVLTQINYGLSNELSFSLLVPAVWMNEEVESILGSQSFNSNGIGDVSIMAFYRHTFQNQLGINSGIGVKLPTGRTNIVSESDGFILPVSMQPGSGSYDPIFLLGISKSMSFRRSFSIIFNSIYRLNTPSKKLTFHNEYEFGDELQMYLGVSDQFAIGRTVHTILLFSKYRYTAQDRIDNSYFNSSTGGQWLYLAPSYIIRVVPPLELGGKFEVPIYRNVNGLQLTTTYKFIGLINFNF